MSWILLILAGLLEACWAVGLKFTEGFTKPLPSVLVGCAIVGSMILLSLALRTLPIGTAYAVWVSIGIVGAVLAQPIFFHQPLRMAEILFITMIIIAVVGLKITSAQK